jgi:hypothetical protein
MGNVRQSPSRVREGLGVGASQRRSGLSHPQPLWLRHACGSPQAGGES